MAGLSFGVMRCVWWMGRTLVLRLRREFDFQIQPHPIPPHIPGTIHHTFHPVIITYSTTSSMSSRPPPSPDPGGPGMSRDASGCSWAGPDRAQVAPGTRRATISGRGTWQEGEVRERWGSLLERMHEDQGEAATQEPVG